MRTKQSITTNQKVLASCQNSLTRWAAGRTQMSLRATGALNIFRNRAPEFAEGANSHRTRRGEQAGFQSVTRLSGFTHHTHRIHYYIPVGAEIKTTPKLLPRLFSTHLGARYCRLKTGMTSIAKQKIVSSPVKSSPPCGGEAEATCKVSVADQRKMSSPPMNLLKIISGADISAPQTKF